jgi:hypothetical protein
MSEGYPDYARLARTGQYQLYNGKNVTPPYDTPFFQGYVGNFPFINVFTNLAAGSDFMQLIFQWYPDSTFTNPIAFRIAVRGSGSFAVTQYANLSDWLQVYYVTKSGLVMTFGEISIYGTQQHCGQRELTSGDTPMFAYNNTIAASSTVTLTVVKISPGESLFNLFSGAVAWNVNFLYYDYGSGTFIEYYTMDQNAFADAAGHIFVPVMDAPMQLAIHNQDTSPRLFLLIWNTAT